MTAAPPDVDSALPRSGELFLLWAPFWRPLVPLGALLGVFWYLMRRPWRSWLGFARCCDPISPKFQLMHQILVRISTVCSRKYAESLRKHAENLRNHDENLPAAPRLQRRIPTRVRRSREASSIRRTLRLPQGAKRFRQCMRNLIRKPSELGEFTSPYPSIGLRETADPPDAENSYPLR